MARSIRSASATASSTAPNRSPRSSAQRTGELDYICSGINHQTWFIDVRLNGRKIGKDELVAAFEAHPVFSQQEKLRIDVLKRFGVYSTESNGHLSEYLPWYRKRPEEITRWIDMSDWIHGETGGYLRYSTETRNWFETEFPQFLEAGRQADRSGTSAPTSMPATSSRRWRPDRVYRGHFNVKNNGVITNLPADAIIESPGFVDRFGINMVSGITLPEACAATCISSINVQRMSVHAAISGDIDLLKLAVLHDPLVGADLHAGGSLADGRRDGRRPGSLAAAICRCNAGRQGAAEQVQGQDPRMGGRRAPRRPLDRGIARRKGGR